MKHRLRTRLCLISLLVGGKLVDQPAAAQPTLTSLTPIRGGQVARAGVVRLNFSQPLAASSAAALRVFSSQQGGQKAGQAQVAGSTLSFTPVVPFAAGEKLWLSLPRAGVVSTSQQSPTTSQVWQLTVAASSSNGLLTPGKAFTMSTARTYSPVDVDGDGDLDLLGCANSTISTQLNDGTSTFVPVADWQLPLSASSTALGDVDGDGDLDLVALGNSSNGNYQHSVHLNAGNGQFGSATPVSGVAGTVSDLSLGDVDGDGDLDMVFTYNTNRLGIRLNNGLGIFPVATATVLAGAFGTAPVLGDVDSDGDLDVVGISSLGDALALRLNSGAGIFSAGPALSAPDVSQVQLADLNGDGALDLLTTRSSTYTTTHTLAVQLNQGGGTFGAASSLAVPAYIQCCLAADVEGDGDLDLLYSYEKTVAVTLNNGNGSFAAPTLLPQPATALQLLALDADNDGDLDVLTTAEAALSRQLTLLRNGPAAPTISLLSATPVNNRLVSRTTPVAATLSAPLAAGAGAALRVLGTQGRGQLPGPATVAGARLELAPATAYFPGEVLNVSLTSAARSTTGLLLGQPRVWRFVAAASGGTGDFSQGTFVYGDGDGGRNLRLADIDADGDLDIITTPGYDYSNNGLPVRPRITVQRNRGNGTFEAPVSLLGDNISCDYFELGDVDGDGDLDFVGHAQYTNPQTLQRTYPGSVWRNNGHGTFTAAGVVDNRSAGVCALGDVDGDGDLDLIDGGVRLNDGQGNFYGAGRLWTAGYARHTDLFDIDGDGDLDCISSSSDYNGVFYQLNNGAGLMGPDTYIGGGFNDEMPARDLDGDGDLDIVLPAYGNTTIVLLNNGQGAFTEAAGTRPNGLPLTLGDVNGDGYPDLVTTSSCYLNNGRAQFGPSSTRVPFSFITGVRNNFGALGDLDGDGDLDLVVSFGTFPSGWIICLNPNQTTLAAAPGVTATDFGTWPNPVAAGGSLTIQLPPGSTAATLTLRTLLGQPVWQQPVSGPTGTVALGQLPAGVYLLSLATPGQPTATQRLTVQ